MRTILLTLMLVAMSYCGFAQNGRNFIKPVDNNGFVVDSILSLKGDMILYLRAGTEFDIAKKNVEYIEHSILGRIVFDDKKKKDKPFEEIFQEPQYNGDAYICYFEDSTCIKMEKAIGQVKIKDQFWGPEMKLYVKPAQSSVRVQKGKLNVIIRVPDNNEDPYSFIKISKFSAGITRKLSLARQNEITGKITYGGRNNQEKTFEVEKYGKSSFLLNFEITEIGEYCIMISNPNKVDNKISVSCFGVDK